MHTVQLTSLTTGTEVSGVEWNAAITAEWHGKLKAGTGSARGRLPGETRIALYSPVRFRHHWFERQISWCLSGGLHGNGRHAAFPLHHATVRFLELYTHAPAAFSPQPDWQERSDWSERGSGNIHWGTDALGPAKRNNKKQRWTW